MSRGIPSFILHWLSFAKYTAAFFNRLTALFERESSARNADELRQAQAILLPLELGLSPAQPPRALGESDLQAAQPPAARASEGNPGQEAQAGAA